MQTIKWLDRVPLWRVDEFPVLWNDKLGAGERLQAAQILTIGERIDIIHRHICLCFPSVAGAQPSNIG